MKAPTASRGREIQTAIADVRERSRRQDLTMGDLHKLAYIGDGVVQVLLGEVALKQGDSIRETSRLLTNSNMCRVMQCLAGKRGVPVESRSEVARVATFFEAGVGSAYLECGLGAIRLEVLTLLAMGG